MNIVSEPEENYKTGWIKVFRSIRNHWIWQDERKLKWWIDILLEVNHSEKPVSIGYRVFTCNRGECLVSLQSWGMRWNVSKSVVNNFFTMLENDGMIKTVNETVTTRLVVCNYESYQEDQNASETQTKRKKTRQSTTKNEENEKKVLVDTNTKTWKDDFLVYKDECRKAFIEFDSDTVEIQKQERLNPNVDIKLTIEKAYDKFWATEAGWKNKKKSGSENIDWRTTIKNAISIKSNIVYRPK